MDGLTLIVLYIFNVIISRWLNKIAYNKTKNNIHNQCSIVPILWFIPIVPILVLLFGIAIHGNKDDKNKKNIITWFLGGNW